MAASVEGDELFVPAGAKSLAEVIVVEKVGEGGETCHVRALVGADGKVVVEPVSTNCPDGWHGTLATDPDPVQGKEGLTYSCRCKP
jgi:hypothetical protein